MGYTPGLPTTVGFFRYRAAKVNPTVIEIFTDSPADVTLKVKCLGTGTVVTLDSLDAQSGEFCPISMSE